VHLDEPDQPAFNCPQGTLTGLIAD
jgi:hypothetical protein